MSKVQAMVFVMGVATVFKVKERFLMHKEGKKVWNWKQVVTHVDVAQSAAASPTSTSCVSFP